MGSNFDDMETDERIYNKVDEGFEKWEERCLKVGGDEALNQWLEAQEHLVYCVMENFNVDEIKREIEAKKKTGDLDLVFKKYCG